LLKIKTGLENQPGFFTKPSCNKYWN